MRTSTALAAAVATALTAASAAAAPVGATVRVPNLRGVEVTKAYSVIRAARLQPQIASAFTLSSLSSPVVVRQLPAAGKRVPAGTRLMVSLGAGPTGTATVTFPLPSAVVPDLRGSTVRVAFDWAASKRLLAQATLPPLPATASARDLLANYVVASQNPAAGATLAMGVALPGGGFQATPLRMRGRVAPRP